MCEMVLCIVAKFGGEFSGICNLHAPHRASLQNPRLMCPFSSWPEKCLSSGMNFTNETENLRALITGASSGIGLALAREFAHNGHPLVITARQPDELRTIAAELQHEFGVEVMPVAQDLTQENAAEELFNELRAGGLDIHVLVNDAGLGQRGKFSDIPLNRDIEILRVNVEAIVRLSKIFLPPMISRHSGAILNVASVAGFEPGPLLAVYHASKAFVLSFSQALAAELAEAGITVTALCPGATETKFFEKADMTDTRVYQQTPLAEPRDVAAAAYKALRRGDTVYVHGGMNKAMVAARRMLSFPAQAKLNQKFYEQVEPAARQRKASRKTIARRRETTLRTESRFYDATTIVPRLAQRHLAKADEDQLGENS